MTRLPEYGSDLSAVEGARMPAKLQSAVLTIEDLAEYLKISKSTLYKLAQEGAVPGQKVGRHWRFHRDAVDQWLCNERTVTMKNHRGRKPR
jgi:excisionase family DNA binding protein